MSKQILFLNMFPDYEPPEELAMALSQAAIVTADINAAARRVHVVVHSEHYIPKRQLDIVCREIASVYGLQRLIITATHPAAEVQKMEPEELMALFVAENSMAIGILAGAQWEWDGEGFVVKLRANGKKTLEECLPRVQQTLRERFAVHVPICFEADAALEGKALFEAMDAIRASMVTEMPKYPSAQKKTIVTAQPSDMLYGKPFKGKSVPMKELNLDMGSVIVEGKVFAVEHKELKKRNAWVINFDMTDNTGSIRVNRFMEAGEAKPFLENVKEGAVLKIQGKLMINQFDNEMVLKPFAMTTGSLPKRKDTAEGEKRVELHLHTSMSNMDALTSTKAAIKQAAAWGHRAIAITDHGCVQSFTDALHTVEDWKGAPKIAGTDETIKILYGCEGYYVNDVDDRIVVHGGLEASFDDEFVAFDLETTGLDPRSDKIIEIGAVIMRRGTELARFQTFVDPRRKLLKETTDLTGITDDMLVGAPDITAALPDFLEFVGTK